MEKASCRVNRLPGYEFFSPDNSGSTVALAIFSPSLSPMGNQRLIQINPIYSMALGY
jgi:hypothetical protein